MDFPAEKLLNLDSSSEKKVIETNQGVCLVQFLRAKIFLFGQSTKMSFSLTLALIIITQLLTVLRLELDEPKALSVAEAGNRSQELAAWEYVLQTQTWIGLQDWP